MGSFFQCNSISTLRLPPPLATTAKASNNSITTTTTTRINLNWHKKHLLHALTGALSLSFLTSAPSSIALDTSFSPQNEPSEYCQEGKEEINRSYVTAPELVSNEEIVAEAWEIVNEGFLDAGPRRWSREAWMQKKEDILSNSIQTRSKAHDIIKRMLASLGDPYTRFLSNEQEILLKSLQHSIHDSLTHSLKFILVSQLVAICQLRNCGAP